MRIFQYNDYRNYLRDTLASRAIRGRGEMQRLAKFAGIHSSILSQVFQGKRDLTTDQAAAVSHYLDLSDGESRFFLLLTNHARAGTERLRGMLQRQIEEARAAEVQVSSRVKDAKALGPAEIAVYHSSWHYSAIRLWSAIPGQNSKELLRKRARLPQERFRQVVAFLVEHGLCREQDGRLSPSSAWTQLEANSPHVGRMHANWRLRAMEKHSAIDLNRELAFTGQMALSLSDAKKIRSRLAAVVDEVCKTAAPSASETVYFLNLDWIEA